LINDYLSKAKDRVDAWQKGIPNILIIAPPPIEDGYEEGDCGEEMGFEPWHDALRKLNDYLYMDGTPNYYTLESF
jgi:hypothetical protein